MKKKRNKITNKGFSMIELIVIMAIMTVAVGATVMSVSLITGSEAKKAYRKIDSMLNEVKTGSMSRLDEDITIVYKTKDTSVTGSGDSFTAGGVIDKDGYYAVKETVTLTTLSGTGSGYADGSIRGASVDERTLGVENRILCDDRANITFYYKDSTGADASITLTPDGANDFTIKYNRATGIFKNCEVNGVEQGLPVKLVITSGLNRTYIMEFDANTGRHNLVK